MTYSVFIDGAAGTTGLEIVERLESRNEFNLVILSDDDRKDTARRRESLNDSDFAILCLPDDAARDAAAMIDPDSKTRVIDASSAHRVADGWTYGFPELIGADAIASASRVSNPGCYPTGFLAMVAPLIRAGLLPADWPYTVNAVSGYSGGGKALIERIEAEPELAFRSYGLDLDHKHRPEMKRHAGLQHEVIFAPAVVRAYRGMVVEVPLHLGAINPELTSNQLHEALNDFYSGSAVITVGDANGASELLLNENASPSDTMKLDVFGSEEGDQARLIARLDNLGKGASGAAIQNLNLMAGLTETTGLRI